jgi:hypothetical protein
MAEASSSLPKVSGEIKATLPKPFKLGHSLTEAADTVKPATVAEAVKTTGLPEEKTFLLHHSFARNIPVGDAIRTTDPKGINQTTAGDAILGYSYAWDAKTGLQQSIDNQVSAQGKGHTVYLTRADTKSVYPDLNVPGTESRAIKGQQEVIDSVHIPAGMSQEEGRKMVSEMTGRHGVVHTYDTNNAAGRALLIEKGDEALANYKESMLMTNLGTHFNEIDRMLASGKGLSPQYGDKDKSINPQYADLARIYLSEGREAAIAHALENLDKFTITTHQQRYNRAKAAIEAIKANPQADISLKPSDATKGLKTIDGRNRRRFHN